MKLTEIRCFPGHHHHLVIMIEDGKQFCYSNNGQYCDTEIFEIYYLNNGRASEGHRSSRVYLLWQGEKPPMKYAHILQFMKEEFNKIDWESKEVMNALTGEWYEKVL